MIRVTLKELENAVNKKPRQKWGKWRYDPNTFYLTYNNWYPVDLTTKDNNSKISDLIFQISTKESDKWDSNCVGDLVKAIADIFHPQENCCSRGVNMQFNAKKLCEAYNERLFINGEVW
tara:strand:+ start:193 stop:549 length:357 start_codon:yes stop_codon:yes gene_type:complete